MREARGSFASIRIWADRAQSCAGRGSLVLNAVIDDQRMIDDGADPLQSRKTSQAIGLKDVTLVVLTHLDRSDEYV